MIANITDASNQVDWNLVRQGPYDNFTAPIPKKWIELDPRLSAVAKWRQKPTGTTPVLKAILKFYCSSTLDYRARHGILVE